jgi:hypothetical protein
MSSEHASAQSRPEGAASRESVMAVESRTITFTDPEILQAVTAYCIKNGRIGSGVKISSPLVTNDGEIRLSFDPVPIGDRITLHEGELLSAMILYCKDQGIPIARRSTKSIHVAKDTFSLRLETPR